MGNLNKYIIPTSLLLLFMTACNPKTVSVKDYMRYMSSEGNGLIQRKEIDAMVFETKYKSPELMALNELKKFSLQSKEWEATLQEYKGLTYCTVSISTKNDSHIYGLLRDEGMSEDNIEAYLNYGAQNNFKLIQGTDTASCVLYNFSKTYGLAKQFDLALGFDTKSTNSDKDKVLEFDAGFLGRGLLKFKFSREDISRIPVIVI